MSVGRASAFGIVLAFAAANACHADAIVKVVNKSNSAVTVRIDGNFGCRAFSKATAPTDLDMPDQCTFGASTGNHIFELQFDGGKSSSKSGNVPASGYVLTLTGNE